VLSSSKESRIAIILIALFYAALLGLNISYPLLPGDDYLYQMVFEKNTMIGSQRLEQLPDLINSTVNHYLNYNYRILPHLVLQFFFLFPNFVFDIANTAVFAILVFLFSRVLNKTTNLSAAPAFLVTSLIIWLFHPDIWWSYLWTTGALNYMWPLVVQLVLVLELRKVWSGEKVNQVLMILCACLAALSNEHVLAAMLLCSVSTLYLVLRRRQDATLMIISSLVLLSGILLMVLAPSFTQRIVTEFGGERRPILNIENTQRLMYYLSQSAVMVILYYFLFKPPKKLVVHALYCMAFVISVGVGFISPLYEARLFVFPFFIILLFLSENVRSLRKHFFIRFSLLLGLTIMIYSSRQAIAGSVKTSHNLLIDQLDKQAGSEEVVINRPVCSKECVQIKNCDDISTDPEHFHNRTIAAYYNISRLYYRSMNNPDNIRACLSHASSDSCQLEGSVERGICSEDLKTPALKISCIRDSNSGNKWLIFDDTGCGTVKSDDKEFIVRAARKRWTDKAKLLIPRKYRVYFLDFLEGDMQYYDTGNDTIAGLPINCLNEYDYLLVSEYSKEKHRVKTPVYILDPEELNSSSKASE